MSADRPLLTVTLNGDGQLELVGELDLTTVGELRAALATRNSEPHITLDLSGLTFIDSSGLQAIAAYAQSREPNETVTLTGASPHLRDVLE